MSSKYSNLRFYANMLLCALCISGVLCCCSGNEDRRMEKALEISGTNRAELEKVLEHYREDSLKLRAARFLIENMQYHFSINENFVPNTGKSYYPDITRLGEASSVRRHCDSLIALGWRIDRRLDYDIRCVDADFIIRNIDLAFYVWRKPWASGVSFEDFCNYILPYRSQNEQLSHGRERLMKRYVGMLDSAGVTNAMDACKIINARLKDEIRYCETGNPLHATIEETETSGIGTCDALCNYTTLVMRSVGIPIAVHQTVWTRMELGHVWCAVLHGGEFYDFSPGDVQPDEYKRVLATKRYLKPAKVYRRHFEPDMSVLPKQDDGFVTFLKNPLLTDVTDEQETPVYDLSVAANKCSSNSGGLVYLCNYNGGKWLPIALGKRHDDSCFFPKVAGRNLLIAAEADESGKLRFVNVPFFTTGDGEVRYLVPDMENRVSLDLTLDKKNSSCTLYYWNTDKDCLEQIASSTANDSIQHYENVPGNALLVKASKKTPNGRAGLVTDGKLKLNLDL